MNESCRAFQLTNDPSNIDTMVEAAFDRIDMRFLGTQTVRISIHMYTHTKIFTIFTRTPIYLHMAYILI